MRKEMAALKSAVRLNKDEKGGAVVEATILFPIIFMIFFALVILAMYLPSRALLQRATQYAATALATGRSDTWLYCDSDSARYVLRAEPDNVYVALFRSFLGGDGAGAAEDIIEKVEESSIQTLGGELEVSCSVTNFVIYKEITVTATRNIPSPINLTFIGFPEKIPITVSSTAVVQNGDEFIRNVDIAKDVSVWLDNKLGISDMFSGVTELFTKLGGILGFK